MYSIPTVTVIIPCYNDGRFLRAALTSVLSQTLRPLEILVIDDGSTDSTTRHILRHLNIPGTRVIRQENRGLPGARNTGIRSSGGSYIYFLDADDSIHPECLAKLTSLLEEQKNAVAAVSKIQLFGGPNHGAVWGKPPNPYEILVQNQWGAGIMLRRSAIEDHDLWYDESMRLGYEDWELNIRLIRTGKDILFCSEPLYRYRIRQRSLLSTTRKHHAQVATYIQAKHHGDYIHENILRIKRTYAPALRVKYNEHEKEALQDWLASQTFPDWSLKGSGPNDESYYYLFYPQVEALWRLPSEALECTLMALECYRQANNCVIAVREGCTSLFAASEATVNPNVPRCPIAIVVRENTVRGLAPDNLLKASDLLVEFTDQRRSTAKGWEQSLIRFSPQSLMAGLADRESIRKKLRLLVQRIVGDHFERGCVQLYDHFYYRVLHSNRMFVIRNTAKSMLGTTVESWVSSLIYGLFLTQVPSDENDISTTNRQLLIDKVSPLFMTSPDNRINILIATAWLKEGGVEQEIFDLCSLLDLSRFRITVVTTLPSAHPWDNLARAFGVSVYHLADFLKPSEMTRGLLHLVFNHHIDCVYIINSQMAYIAAKRLKQVLPWLPIIDRNVAEDPGGGFPQVSVKVGGEAIDLRTVSHRNLAERMHDNYRIPRDSLRVIYAGTNLKQISGVHSQKLLHNYCRVTENTPLVIFIGRFAQQKRPTVFVRSVGAILKIDRQCNAHFAMVGDGDLMPIVKQLISELNLTERIHLLGAYPNAVELLADATLLMMPSAYEGLALVSYEAMALGIPQIFANVNGQPELITPETGILIDNGPDEETRYAKACLELLSDPDRCARIAAAGKERIKSHFSAENAVKEYAQIFEEMAELGRKRASEMPHLKPPHLNPLRDFI